MMPIQKNPIENPAHPIPGLQAGSNTIGRRHFRERIRTDGNTLYQQP